MDYNQPWLTLFSQAATSQDKWLTSQMCNFPSVCPKAVLAAALTPPHPKLVLIVSISPLTHPSRSARPPIAACSVRLRRPNLTYWKVLPGKLFVKKSPLGKTPLGNT